jgi:hypothetical protein
MKLHTFRAASVSAVALLALSLFCSPGARAQGGVEKRLTVGIFSRAYLVQAFYRSEAWKAKMQSLAVQRNQAAAASDISTVDRVDKELNDAQTLAQRQLAGTAPLTNIYDVLKDQWAAIAQEAGVDIIVEPPLYITPGSALIDVTPVIVKHLAKRG